MFCPQLSDYRSRARILRSWETVIAVNSKMTATSLISLTGTNHTSIMQMPEPRTSLNDPTRYPRRDIRRPFGGSREAPQTTSSRVNMLLCRYHSGVRIEQEYAKHRRCQPGNSVAVAPNSFQHVIPQWVGEPPRSSVTASLRKALVLIACDRPGYGHRTTTQRRRLDLCKQLPTSPP